MSASFTIDEEALGGDERVFIAGLYREYAKIALQALMAAEYDQHIDPTKLNNNADYFDACQGHAMALTTMAGIYAESMVERTLEYLDSQAPDDEDKDAD